MKKDQCIVFPHIPKCGGTSLKSQLEKSNIKVYFDYDKPPHNTRSYFNEECNRRNWETSLLDFKQFDLVFGHFPADRYRRENYKYVTLLRHPMDRALSHFFYWKNLLPKTNQVALSREPIISEIKEGRISFLEFIKMKKIDSFYSSYLSKLKPSDFMLVGFIDKYDCFFNRLSEYLDIQLDPAIHARQGIKEEICQSDMGKAEDMLNIEIERYNEFRKYWTK